MEGSSHGAWVSTLEACRAVEQTPGSDLRGVAAELFSVSELTARESKLRRALADPSRDAWPKQDLARRVFTDKLSDPAMRLVLAAVGSRWRRDHDLTDALERLGVNLIFAAAERDGRLNKLEDELFSIQAMVEHHQGVVDALSRRDVDAHGKVELVHRLLDGKVSGDAVWLATRPAINPRGRHFARTIWSMLAIADLRRRAVTAVVTSAIELTSDQKHRIEAALTRIYGRPVNANLIVDSAVLGGIQIRVGDDFIDGSIRRLLDDAGESLTKV